MRIVTALGTGMLGGAAGTAAMSVGMVLSQLAGARKRPPPVEMEHELERRAGVAEETSATVKLTLASGLHLAIGVGFGALYGMLRARLPLNALWAGPLYGLAVYVVSLAGFGPAFGLTTGPWQERTTTVTRRIALHLVYGLVTAIVTERVQHAATEQASARG
jgi:uncharacterized membrane protein YagU involved in acid resistance